MRLLRLKLHRAFPELDPYPDDQARRFVDQASRSGRNVWIFTGAAILYIVLGGALFVGALVLAKDLLDAGNVRSDFAFDASIILGILLFALGGFLVRDITLRILIRKLLDERATCGACRYSLVGLPIDTSGKALCPECGTRSKVDPSLYALVRNPRVHTKCLHCGVSLVGLIIDAVGTTRCPKCNMSIHHPDTDHA
ncbi:MAG: hypothetical protein AB7Q00_10065 [Phycisphaerales bacterium]